MASTSKRTVHERTADVAVGEVEGGGLDGRAVEAHRPGAERFDASEGERPGSQYGRVAVRTRGGRGAIVAQAVDTPIRKGDVDLEPMGLPVRGHRLDPDPCEADLPAVVRDPHAHRVAHLGVVGALREHVLPGGVDAPGQIDCHVVLLAISARSSAGRGRRIRRTGAGPVEVEPEVRRVALRARLAVLGVLRPTSAACSTRTRR